MAKKKKQLADKIRVNRNKRKEAPKTVNPFEVKINHQKHDVLGRKISKHDKGMPGLSRSKATKRRKETLLHDYENQFKANKFVDQRFGETDPSLSLEDKMLKRFAIERLKMADKHSKFNLNEDEELTHYGQSLSQIEKFEDPDDSDEEEDDDDGRIGAKMVSEEHFGGFMTKKEAEDARDARSWKEKMEDVIAKSKKEKYDRQIEKEKTKEMTEKLDEEWSSLRMLMSSLSKAKGSKGEETVQKKVDDYDIAVRELQFEMKGKATDRMKTEEEIAREEKEKLDKLEMDRIRRMKGITEEEIPSEKRIHFSADDLDDGFVIDGAGKEKFQVSYKDGKMQNYEDVEAHVSADDEEGDEKSDSDDDNEDDEKEDVTEENEEEESGDDSDNSDDSYGDIASEDEEAEESGDKQEEDKEVTISLEKNRMSKEKFDHKAMIEAATKEIPYTFSVPENYEALLDLLQEHNVSDQITIMQRVCTCHHPSLAEGNKSLLETFFGLLVQYYGDLALQKPPQLHLMDQMMSILYSLTQQSPVAAAQAVVDQIANMQKEFKQICDRRAGRGMYPGLDTLLMFKLVSMLFPTSDLYHPVTTPSLLFLCQMLAQCSVSQERDVAAGLFVCSICLEYVSLSKRYIPEVVNFLHGLLFLAAEKDPNKSTVEPVVPPFKPVGKNVNLLLLSKAMPEAEIKKWKMSELLSTDVERQAICNDEFRLSAIHNSLILIREYSNLYAELPSYKEIFTPITNMCKKLPVQDFPTALQKNLKNLMENICANCERKRKFLVIQNKKPQPLKMYEPKVEEVFDGKKSKQKGTKDFTEHQRLIHKHKRELKGAIREIKKDNQFLARQKLQKQLLLDAERKRKVKQIYAMLSTQEGDYKAMKRKKVE